jgi:hypothetical protein
VLFALAVLMLLYRVNRPRAEAAGA